MELVDWVVLFLLLLCMAAVACGFYRLSMWVVTWPERRRCPVCRDLGEPVSSPETWCHEHYWAWLAASKVLSEEG